MTVPNLATLTRKLHAPYYSSKYEVVMSLPSGVSGNAEDLIFRVMSASTPESTITPVEWKAVGGHKMITAGRSEMSQRTTIEFSESDGQPVYDLLSKWYELIYDKENAASSHSNEHTTTITVYALDASNKRTYQWDYLHSFLINLPQITMDNDSSTTPVTYSAEFAWTTFTKKKL